MKLEATICYHYREGQFGYGGRSNVGQGGPFNATNAVVTFPVLAGPPANPQVGQAYFDTTLGYPLIYMQDNTWHGFAIN